ncbi:hypothetical protein [Thalassotalea marina]|uniref:Uncharacterized protein n=1 Tax=Thalassotalea marina TaxID=1673741 RepID=A0A919BPT6_9GAMM|nr:hypothetical protein [Thalassotalea marina]GHG04196.1 hypothetical protein GCM10017161_37070 [Thalassotalea marina]
MKNLVITVCVVILVGIFWYKQFKNPSNKSTSQSKFANTNASVPPATKATVEVGGTIIDHSAKIQKSTEASSDFQNTINKEQQKTPQLTTKKHLPFDEQEIDYLWADAINLAMQDLFVINEDVNHISLKDVKCKTTQCYFSVYINDDSDVIAEAQKIGKVIKEKWPEYTFYFKSKSKDGVLNMELSRFNER